MDVLKSVSDFFLLVFSVLFLSILLNYPRAESEVYVQTGQRTTSEEIRQIQSTASHSHGFLSYSAEKIYNTVSFSWGNTLHGKSVFTEIYHAFVITWKLSLASGFLSLILGIWAGMWGGFREKTGYVLEKMGHSTLSIPIFLISLGFIWFFSGYLAWLPPGGTETDLWMVLPVVAMSIKSTVRMMLFTMDFIRKQRKRAYYRMHRAFGLKFYRIKFIFLLKNMAIPLAALWIMDFTHVISGSAIVETIFSIPGIGYLTLKSINMYDMNLFSSILISVSFFIYILSLLQKWLNLYFSRYEN